MFIVCESSLWISDCCLSIVIQVLYKSMEEVKRASLICFNVDGQILERIILRTAKDIIIMSIGRRIGMCEDYSNNYRTQL